MFIYITFTLKFKLVLPFLFYLFFSFFQIFMCTMQEDHIYEEFIAVMFINM